MFLQRIGVGMLQIGHLEEVSGVSVADFVFGQTLPSSSFVHYRPILHNIVLISSPHWENFNHLGTAIQGHTKAY